MNYNSYEGVAINGGFFDINKSFRPMSYFNNERLQTDNKIQRVYFQHFGFYYIDTQGILRLKRFSPEDINRNTEYEACGPILVDHGQIVMTSKIMNQVYGGIKMFQCALPNDPNDNRKILDPDDINTDTLCPRVPIPKEEIPNCNTIIGGELSHASNYNPRSMILTRKDSSGRYQVVFVVVEGRNERTNGADGMDLVQLAQFAVARYQAYMAINLDGGASSNIVLKNSDGTLVVNQKKETKYPIGNIISLVR